MRVYSTLSLRAGLQNKEVTVMAKARSFQKLQAWYHNRRRGSASELSNVTGRPQRQIRTRTASSFALESLEARLLLSADLAAAVPIAPVAQNVAAQATVSVINPTQTTATVQTNNAVSPHLASLRIADFGRSYNENSWGNPDSPSRTEAAVQWFAQHVDLTEQETVLSHFRQYNPTMQSWKYALDLYQFQNEVSGLPESSFLHVSEPTSVTLKDISGNTLANYTIPTGGRFEAAVWNAKHFPFNLKDANLRAYNSARILNLIGNEAGVFLDAHGSGFSDPFKVGWLTVINSGGGIQEYGGRRPGDPIFEAAYNADVVSWLNELRGQLVAAGKWGVVNEATNLGYDQMSRDQAIAIGGFDTENLIAPDMLRGPDSVNALYNLTQRVTADGGTAILTGQWNAIPNNYTPGDYSSAAARQDMWRLSFYYLVKEAAGSPGHAYLDLNLQSYATHSIPGDQNQWHAAYQVDIGQPMGGMTVAQDGSSPSDGAYYSVFTRSYTNAQVLFRPMDLWSSTNYGDASAVTVPLNGNYQQLKEDGTLGPVTNSVQIRNSEALILIPVSGVTSNVVANNTPSTPLSTPVSMPPPVPVIDPAPITVQPQAVPVVIPISSAGSETKTVAEILAPPLLATPAIPTVTTVSSDTVMPPSQSPVAPPAPNTPELVVSMSLTPASDSTPVTVQPTSVPVVTPTSSASSESNPAAEILPPPLPTTPAIPTVSTVSNDTASKLPTIPVAPPSPNTPEPVVSMPLAPSPTDEESHGVQIPNGEKLPLMPAPSMASNVVVNDSPLAPPAPVSIQPSSLAVDPTPVNVQPTPLPVIITAPPAASETKTGAEIPSSPIPSTPPVSPVSHDAVIPLPLVPAPVTPPAAERTYTVAEMLAMDWKTTQ
jgi:hypothetical protein